ncbi:hypothetical protein NC652_031918 [Populus alba x Populus x berolinensis]|nr:hypothetical protein NC652_031918 [Populus alba x Populus x berolinensis]
MILGNRRVQCETNQSSNPRILGFLGSSVVRDQQPLEAGLLALGPSLGLGFLAEFLG